MNDTPEALALINAYCIVNEARMEIMREQRRISSHECRKLRRVLDYLDILSDIEMMEWPDVIDY